MTQKKPEVVKTYLLTLIELYIFTQSGEIVSVLVFVLAFWCNWILYWSCTYWMFLNGFHFVCIDPVWQYFTWNSDLAIFSKIAHHTTLIYVGKYIACYDPQLLFGWFLGMRYSKQNSRINVISRFSLFYELNLWLLNRFSWQCLKAFLRGCQSIQV